MNWETMTDLIDRPGVSWVQVVGSVGCIILALVVLSYVWSYLKLQLYVWKLNRRQRKAAEALAKRGGRTWPL